MAQRHGRRALPQLAGCGRPLLQAHHRAILPNGNHHIACRAEPQLVSCRNICQNRVACSGRNAGRHCCDVAMNKLYVWWHGLKQGDAPRLVDRLHAGGLATS